MGTLAINIQMPFEIICVQCNKQMKWKGSSNLPTCPQCGFKVKLIISGPTQTIPGLKPIQPSKFKRPQPMA